MRATPAAVLRASAVVLAGAGSVLAACGGEPPAPPVSLSATGRAGFDIAAAAGCQSCHGANFVGGAVGPPWVGLAGSTVKLKDGSTVVADTAYLTEAIMDPAAKLTAGYTGIMPKNALSAEDVAKVVAYIQEIGG